jgi:hypothetical protein
MFSDALTGGHLTNIVWHRRVTVLQEVAAVIPQCVK